MNTPPAPKVLRWINTSLVPPALVETGQALLAACTRPWGENRTNEDAIAIMQLGPAHHMLLLADGVGGLPGGAQASGIAIESLIEAITLAHAQGHPLQQGVIQGFDAANLAIQKESSGGATTLMAVEIEGGRLRTYHAGDSGVLVTGQRGRLKLMTMAHSPVGYAQEAGLLTEDEAMHHEERHVVSNLLGSPDMRIEIGQLLQLSPLDTLVVGSDGLFDNLLSEEIAETIRKGPLLSAAETLRSRSDARMTAPEPQLPSKPDDLSFILYRPRRVTSKADANAGSDPHAGLPPT